MSWRPRELPTLRELVAYVVDRSRQREATLTTTKLLKLLYLIDVESVASGSQPATRLEWVFFHYGPYSFELAEELRTMEGRELNVRPYYDAVMYLSATDVPAPDGWPAPFAARVDRIVDRWAGEELNLLLV